MPPEGDRVPADQIALIAKWIDMGLRENAGSSVAAVRTLGFKPTAPASNDGPGAVPTNLPSIERPKTLRPFPVLALAASPRAPVAAAASYGAIDLYGSLADKYGALPFPEGEPLVLAFSRSGRLLLAAGGKPVQSGSVVLFDVASGKRLASVGDEPDAIIAADISPDEKLVAIGCTSRKVKLYSTEDGSLKATLDKHTDWVTAVAFSPDGKYLATGDRIGNIHLWDGATGGVLDCRFGPQGELATCGRDGLVKLWSAEGDETKKFSVADDTPADAKPPAGVKLMPTRVAVSGDGSFVLAGDTAGRLHGWTAK